jgi:hypothetical protein
MTNASWARWPLGTLLCIAAVVAGRAETRAAALCDTGGLCAVDTDTVRAVMWRGTNATWGSWNAKADVFSNIAGHAKYVCVYGSTGYTGGALPVVRGARADTKARNYGRSNNWYSASCPDI